MRHLPLDGPLPLLLKFKPFRKAGCREMTHSDIFKDGVSLPLSNIEIMITGSRSGNGDTSPYSYVLSKCPDLFCIEN